MFILYVIIAIIYFLIFNEYIQVDFSARYNIVTICIYLISNILYFRKKNNIVSFEFLFAISFIAANFLTFFILEEGSGYAFLAFSAKSQSLVKGIALAMIGYHLYMCGLLSHKETRRTELNTCKKNLAVSKSAANWANWICLMTFCWFIVNGGMSVLYIYSGEVERGDASISFLLYWILAYTVAIYTSFASANFLGSKSNIHNLLKLNKIFIFNSVIIVLFLLVSGYRSQVMQVIIPVLVCYSFFVKKMSTKHFFLVLLSGLILMIVIGMTRSGGEVERNVSTIHYFRDFNAANASLGFFVDEVERNGISGGSNYIPQALSIVPFLQSFVGAFVDFDRFALPSSKLYTRTFDTGSGFGTNIIGDIYYTYGLLGVMIIMFIVGKFCHLLSTFKNKYIFLMYLFFTGNAIFMVRVELLYVVRMLAFGCILLLVIMFLTKQKRLN